jgi:diguanylate cyclase (GGDEF)-like protein/PAS domain S-box-containing protein
MAFSLVSHFVFLCGLLSILIALYAWRHHSTGGSLPFAYFMLCLSIYIVGYGFELSSRSLETMLFWSKIEYLGILTFPTAYLIFVIQFTGRGAKLTRKFMLLIFIVPVLFLLVKLLDDRLRLIYATTLIDTSGYIPLLMFTRGPLYLVIVGYNLVIVTIANYFLLQKMRFGSSLYRKQTSIMLGSASIIYFMYIVYLLGIPVLPNLKSLDLNPIVYTLWGAATAVSIFRYRLFDLVPIARDALIEMLSDGVVVLDTQSRIVDGNPAALKIFGWRKLPLGETFKGIMKQRISLEILHEIKRSMRMEVDLQKNGMPVYYEITISTFNEKQDQPIGYLIVIHDISERKEFEKKLKELSLVDELTGLANRHGFKMLAEQMITMTNRMNLNLSLFYVDLDRLKWINDNLGHATGDQALKDTADILRKTFRSSDLTARLGGDEFVVLAIETDDNSRDGILARLHEQLQAHNLSNPTYQLSFSTGWASYVSNQDKTMEILLEEADRCMYEQKLLKRKYPTSKYL